MKFSKFSIILFNKQKKMKYKGKKLPVYECLYPIYVRTYIYSLLTRCGPRQT